MASRPQNAKLVRVIMVLTLAAYDRYTKLILEVDLQYIAASTGVLPH